ncbi:hypothetical protein GCM10022251_75350 [Phytohabitans flavus]|uniref:Uncharacterized protein n=1 Tax=Phytohabitans flavus TaxID=1076124 RepID=A0A6F8XMD1_9ACTN|nr:hypothetical protein [Phytohabitans flavus]BCB74967.1 hypothetical protein Pflav_013770 [Phytohabitans flavus]
MPTATETTVDTTATTKLLANQRTASLPLPRLLGAALDIWGTDRSTGTALRQTLTTLRDFPHASTEATVEYGLDLLRKLASGAPGEAAATLVAARQQQIRNDATTGQPLTQSGEGALQICAAHKDPVGVRHAAFRSCTDR